MKQLLFLAYSKEGRLQRSWSQSVMSCDQHLVNRLRKACETRGVVLVTTLVDGDLLDAIDEMEVAGG